MMDRKPLYALILSIFGLFGVKSLDDSLRGKYAVISTTVLILSHWPIVKNEEQCYWWMSKDYKPIPSNIPMRWTNPCGAKITNEDENFVPTVVTRKAIITKIKSLVQFLEEAENSFNNFKNRYSTETFGRQVCEHHKEWEGQKYDWLPDIPKKLGIPTDPDHMDNIELNTFLVESYRWLQVVDVGLEQSLYDWQLEKDTGSPGFHNLFEDIWRTNNKVLCEVWDFANERMLKLMPDVGREIMGNEFRNIAPFGQRSLRDWIIFRTYMTLIEYLTDVFKFFLEFRREDLWVGIPDGLPPGVPGIPGN